MSTENLIQEIYKNRFQDEYEKRDKVWKVLTKEYFQRFINDSATVLEVAAGYCHFINNVNCKNKIAIDINPDITKYANKDVQILISTSTDIQSIQDSTIDNIFISNFFEHLTKDDILKTLKECHRILKNNGNLMILQPNIRYCAKDYWMFFDHITPIDDRALVEVLSALGFEIKLHKPKFLPYTMKSKFPTFKILISIFLKISFLQSLMGKQSFTVAQKS